MKIKTMVALILSTIILISCGDNESLQENKAAGNPAADNEPAGGSQGGIVGQWKQEYTCFDKNGNYTLEPEEKTPSNTRLGFDWFHFKANGSCLRDSDLKFESAYEIEEKNGKRKLLIHSGDNINYTIAGLTDKELILAKDGAFIVFKKIK